MQALCYNSEQCEVAPNLLAPIAFQFSQKTSKCALISLALDLVNQWVAFIQINEMYAS